MIIDLEKCICDLCEIDKLHEEMETTEDFKICKECFSKIENGQ